MICSFFTSVRRLVSVSNRSAVCCTNLFAVWREGDCGLAADLGLEFPLPRSGEVLMRRLGRADDFGAVLVARELGAAVAGDATFGEGFAGAGCAAGGGAPALLGLW